MPSFKNHYFNLCFLNDFFASKTIDWLMKWSTLQARKTKISFVTLIRFRFKGYSLKFGIYAPITTKQSQIQQFTFEENQLINIYNFQIERQGYLLLRSIGLKNYHRGSRMINWNDVDSLFNHVSSFKEKLIECRPNVLKGTDRLFKVVKLSVQCCGQIF